MIKTKVLRIWKKNDRNGAENLLNINGFIAMTAFLPRRSKNIQMHCNLTNTPREQIKYTVCTYIANK